MTKKMPQVVNKHVLLTAKGLLTFYMEREAEKPNQSSRRPAAGSAHTEFSTSSVISKLSLIFRLIFTTRYQSTDSFGFI